MFTIIWLYTVKPEHIEAFEKTYAQDGAWAQLFARDPHYVGTTLHKSHKTHYQHMTIDTWTSAEAYHAFRRAHQADYKALDQQCDSFTVNETHVGSFESL